MAKKNNLRIYLPLFLITMAVIGGAIYWYIDYKKYITTDDAYITSDIITISPKIMGRLGELFVDEGDSVHQGQLLAVIDSTDILAQKQQTVAAKAQAEAGKLQAQAKYEFDTKSIQVQKLSMEKAQDDYNRAKTQFSGGVITGEQFDHLKKAYEIAQAQYSAAQAQLKITQSQIGSAQATINSSDAQINVIDTQLKNTRLYSPSDGLVAKRWLLPGDIVTVGQSVFTINNNTRYWIVVNLEETKMEKIHLNQDVLFTIDTYPGVTFKGKIYDIGSTTASQFSLIPPSNASGNFTKVTQRVPLKISIDSTKDGKSIKDFRLLTGMSAVVKIIK